MDTTTAIAVYGAIVATLLAGWQIATEVLDRAKARPRVRVNAGVRHIVIQGIGIPGLEGPNLVVEAVNAGPDPITLVSAFVLYPDRKVLALFKSNKDLPVELTHGQTVHWLYGLGAADAPIDDNPTGAVVYDTLGREWKASKRDVKRLTDQLREHYADGSGE